MRHWYNKYQKDIIVSLELGRVRLINFEEHVQKSLDCLEYALVEAWTLVTAKEDSG